MRIKQKNLYLVFIVLFIAITAGIDLYVYSGLYYKEIYIQRQYGNEIKFNFLSIMVLWGLVLINWKRFRFPKNDTFSWFFLLSLISIVLPNGQDRILSLIGVFQITKYFLIYLILINIYTFDAYEYLLKKVFILILWIETICGVLQEFFGIQIPFLSSRNIMAYRNGFLRMPGTFPFAAEFALFISILLMYFAIEYFIAKDLKMKKYVVFCLFDLWFAGSRTIIVISALVIAFIIWQKNRNHLFRRVLIILSSILLCVGFLNSSIFREMFIENDIFFMLSTRMVHWKMGFSIIKENCLMGVGLNNSVNYVISNPGIVEEAYLRSIEKVSFYFTNPIHNSILIMASELGIIGGGLYMGLFLKMLRCMIKNFKNKRFRKSALFIGCSGMIFLVYAMQGWGLLKEFAWMMIVMVLAYIKLLSEKRILIDGGGTV